MLIKIEMLLFSVFHQLRLLKKKSLDKNGLQHLTSLQQLHVLDCLKLESMPKEGLPTSLSIIQIEGCPLLRKWWQSKKGKERREIPDVDHVLIDGEEYIG